MELGSSLKTGLLQHLPAEQMLSPQHICWAGSRACAGQMRSPVRGGVLNNCDGLEWEWVHWATGETGRVQETGPGSGEMSGGLEGQSLWWRPEGWEDHGIRN